MVAFTALKDRVSLVDTMKLLNLEMQEQPDSSFRGPCPRCNAGGKRALVVTPSRGAFCWHVKKGGDQLWLVSHILGLQIKEAAEWLDKPTETKQTKEQGFPALDYLKADHPAVQEIISEESALAFGVGHASKGVLRGCVAVPVHDTYGVRLGYIGIEQDGSYRFPQGFLHVLHIYNAHQVQAREVHVLSNVQDVLRAREQGIEDCVCFLTPTLSADQLRTLAHWLDDTDRVAVVS